MLIFCKVGFCGWVVFALKLLNIFGFLTQLSCLFHLTPGRCAISNPTHSFPTYFISAEFDIIYGLFHPGRAALHGFGLFGGTNGFWKRSLLKHVGMDPTMLTEDIDSAFRSLEAGARIVYDMNVVSYELAPETFAAFWNQRVRWAQGWVQVTLR